MRHAIGAFIAGAAVLAGSPALAAAEPDLRFHVSQYDSPGSDKRSPESLNAEWISLINTGRDPVKLEGWSVQEAQGRTYTFGAVKIPGKGGKVRLHTGHGVDTATDVYWNSGNYIWNNTGDQATLRDPDGKTRDLCGWGYRNGRTSVGC
ncbi:lamin tail domain-containing protein [Actinoplanes derwentensis]|uniref:Lamin Tail Domain n=1 Tax=Actinoplanes derwentensis TaxID=113562 RepID=A0A1H1ZJ31_9ACTN|nr:lamin tail domain-containing protein [Actinoplanes derwentensis]GID82465.1 hypothetical protein Ade03nite_13890 [Actinoplanes derwentensis]SDT33670.1 Lamin Tail Domain [Actinoplanes derwentensis]